MQHWSQNGLGIDPVYKNIDFGILFDNPYVNTHEQLLH